MGPKAVRGSEAARRLAALLLESWCGLRTSQSASEAMGVSAPRYYQLEARALQALVAAMEPRPRGRQRTAVSELQRVQVEKQRLQRDLERYQMLYRASQRALGVVAAKAPVAGKDATGKRRRRPRRRARAEVVATVLRSQTNEVDHGDGTTEQGQRPRGRVAGRQSGEAAAAAVAADDDRRAVGADGV
jgi:hypothetical protein